MLRRRTARSKVFEGTWQIGNLASWQHSFFISVLRIGGYRTKNMFCHFAKLPTQSGSDEYIGGYFALPH